MLPDIHAGFFFMSSLLLLTIRRGDYLFIYYLLIYFSFTLFFKRRKRKTKQIQAKAKIEPARTDREHCDLFTTTLTIRCEFFFFMKVEKMTKNDEKM